MTQRINHRQQSPKLLKSPVEFTASPKQDANRVRSMCMACALVTGALCTAPTEAAPHDADVKEVMSKNLSDLPGKEGLVLRVTYPPGGADMVHRHDAHGFVYVLEGSVLMQVEGGQLMTLHAGQSFYEGPQDVHVVGRNASSTKPATLVVFLVKNKGAPVLTPVR